MRHIAFLQLLLVDVIVDVNGLTSRIASEFFHEISGHAGTYQICGEPMTAAMWCEVVLKSTRIRIVEGNTLGCFGHYIDNTLAGQPHAFATDE